jgi:hypothetical protein
MRAKSGSDSPGAYAETSLIALGPYLAMLTAVVAVGTSSVCALSRVAQARHRGRVLELRAAALSPTSLSTTSCPMSQRSSSSARRRGRLALVLQQQAEDFDSEKCNTSRTLQQASASMSSLFRGSLSVTRTGVGSNSMCQAGDFMPKSRLCSRGFTPDAQRGRIIRMSRVRATRVWWAIAATLVLTVAPFTRASAAPVVEDVARQAGIYEVNFTFSAAPKDYDSDGDIDLWIGYHNKGGKLWRNDGGVFTRVNPTAWPARKDRHDCAWGDANVDGRLDMYCTVGRTGANIVKDDARDNELWLQQPDGTFVDRGTAWGVGDPYGRGRATTFIKANGDQYPDLFVGNELPRSTDPDGGARGENKLFLNQSGQRFVAAPGFGLNQFVGAFCAHPIDYNRDGWQDLFLCGSKASVLYRNNAGQGFTQTTASSGIITAKRKDADFGDLDGDGDLDVVSISPLNVKYQLFANGVFASGKTIMTLTKGRETALGDADGDGDLDVYVLQTSDSTGNRPDYIFLNNGLSFSRLDVPAATGSGDTVEPLDYDRNGTADFVVLNGQLDDAGPTQLIRVRIQ